MQVKTFRARTIQEALQLVRSNLGPDAHVLDTREVTSRLMRRSLIEVDAGLEFERPRVAGSGKSPSQNSALDHSVNRFSVEDDEPSLATQILAREMATEMDQTSASTVGASIARPESAAALHRSTSNGAEHRASADLPPVSHRMRPPSPAAKELLQELLSADVEAELSVQLVWQALQRLAEGCHQDIWLLRGQVCQVIAEQLKVAAAAETNAQEQRMVAIVGPSGVGKTSLLSSLALQAYKQHNQSIGIFSVDSWKHGSAQPLIQLAESVSAQLEIVSSLENLETALQRLLEFDLVLIDTAGRSPQDEPSLLMLRELLEISQPTETLLAIDAARSQAHIQQTLQQFQAVGASHLAITKMDETNRLGHWITPLQASKMPLVYLASNREAQPQISVASPRLFAWMLIGHHQAGKPRY